MAPQQHSIPCGYAKAIMGVLAILVTLMMYGLSQAAEARKLSQDTEVKTTGGIAELRTDVKYIREAITRLEQRKP